ncbi:hypothetical protein Y032_0457g1796 [Ancylostoma ceylanicum]|uniref:Uncharacterized protein n=1 Tax=Ancylostoma ceylanicum TaxID=53326 RepID=A0A016WXP1_9BILA|nr:hypothetical protein Y032_0457g1796 [Ancylostoma ceylanicum]
MDPCTASTHPLPVYALAPSSRRNATGERVSCNLPQPPPLPLVVRKLVLMLYELKISLLYELNISSISCHSLYSFESERS